MKHRLHRFRGWLLSLIPALSLACGDAEVSAPQPTPMVIHSCSRNQCETCYVYTESVECIKG